MASILHSIQSLSTAKQVIENGKLVVETHLECAFFVLTFALRYFMIALDVSP